MRVELDLSKRDIELVTRLLFGRSRMLRMKARSAVAPRIFQPTLRAMTIKEREAQQRKKARRYKREAGTLRRISKGLEKYLED